MAITKARVTEEEFMALPDDGYKHELVDGEITTVPANFEHDAIGGNIVAILGQHTRGRGFLTISQAGFRMRSRNIRCPDVSFTSRERVPGGRPPRTFGEVAPDLCIEIISTYESRSYIERRLDEYFESGAQLVWHIYPESQQISVFSSPDECVVYDAEHELTASGLFPDFRCQVKDIFDLG